MKSNSIILAVTMINLKKISMKYSALNVPLTFLTDDILSLTVNNNSNFFRLTANKSKDKRDHYFFFKVQTPLENKMVRIFQYTGHKFTNQK